LIATTAMTMTISIRCSLRCGLKHCGLSFGSALAGVRVVAIAMRGSVAGLAAYEIRRGLLSRL
jgi:hypothetical protein